MTPFNNLQAKLFRHAARPWSRLLAAYLALSFATLPLAANSPAADWPMFRGGPALLGVASGQLPAKLNLLWTFKTGGPVKSSAAIVGQRVFIGSHDGLLYELDLATGSKIWST